MPFRNLIAVLGVGLTLTACADLFTVGRVNEIPDRMDFKKIDSDENLERYEKKQAKAIHLDAQQRLFIATAQGYCAEPSPDALASYAASLGFDLDIFNQGSGSLTQALKNDAASIGLRTQSITLMRDALYRMCEASNNGHLDETEVAAFLRRSQDLTAVVLAIEQLTGAVAANQVILTPSARAMEKAVEAKKKAVKDAQLNLDKAEAEKHKVEITKNQKMLLSTECNKTTKDKKQCLKEETEKQQAERAFSEKQEQVKTAKAELEAAKEHLKDVRELRDMINTGQYSPVIQHEPLNDEATKSVATAVENMVKNVLKKSYSPDVCLRYLISSEKRIQNIQERVSQKIQSQIEASQKILPQIEASPKSLPLKTQARLNLLAIQERAKQEEGASAIEALATQDPEDPTIQDPAIQEIYTSATREIEKLQRLGNLCEKIILKSVEKKSDD